jgi:hypothetical protein
MTAHHPLETVPTITWNTQRRHQRRILDVNKLLQHAERGRRCGVGDGSTHRVPPSIEQQPVAAVEGAGVLHA